jgi:hypothetical protein
MATFTADIVFSAGAANTGQAANVLYTVIDSGDVTRIASTGSGVTEETDAAGNAVTGVYRAKVTLDTSWAYPLRIKFVITGKTGVAGLGSFGQDRAILNNDGFTPTRAGYLDVLNGLVAAVWAVAMTDIASVPTITASVKDAINWLFVLGRNKRTQTATTETVFKDDGTTTSATSTKSDDGSVFTRGKYS